MYELSRWFLAFTSIALKAAIVLPILLFQKPYCKSKAKELCLSREETVNLDEWHPKLFAFRRKNHSASPAKYNAPLAKHNLLFSYAKFNVCRQN